MVSHDSDSAATPPLELPAPSGEPNGNPKPTAAATDRVEAPTPELQRRPLRPPRLLLIAMFASSLVPTLIAIGLVVFKPIYGLAIAALLAAFVVLPAVTVAGLRQGKAWAARLAVSGLAALGSVALLAGAGFLYALIYRQRLPADWNLVFAGLGALLAIHMPVLFHRTRAARLGRLATRAVALIWMLSAVGLSCGLIVMWLASKPEAEWRHPERSGPISVGWALGEVLLSWPAGIALVLSTALPWRWRSSLAVVLAAVIGLGSIVAYERFAPQLNESALDLLQASLVSSEIDYLQANALLQHGKEVSGRSGVAALRRLADDANAQRRRPAWPAWPDAVHDYRDSAFNWETALSQALNRIAYGDLDSSASHLLWQSVPAAPKAVAVRLPESETSARLQRTAQILKEAQVAGEAAAEANTGDAWWHIAATLRVQAEWIQDQLRPISRDSWTYRLVAANPRAEVIPSLDYGRLVLWALAAARAATRATIDPEAIKTAWREIGQNPWEQSFATAPLGGLSLAECLGRGGTVVGTFSGYYCRDDNASPLLLKDANSLPDAIAGQQYPSWSFGLLASGGKPPYLFRQDPTRFGPPLGLTIDLNGNLTGMPRQPQGQREFGVCADDSVGHEQCITVSLRVASKLTISPDMHLPDGEVGTYYSAKLAGSVSGGYPPYHFGGKAGGFSCWNGICLSEDGSISGAPQGYGSANLSICVSDQTTPAQTACTQTPLSIAAVVDMAAIRASITTKWAEKGYTVATLTCTPDGRVRAPASPRCYGSITGGDTFVVSVSINADGAWSWNSTPLQTQPPASSGPQTWQVRLINGAAIVDAFYIFNCPGWSGGWVRCQPSPAGNSICWGGNLSFNGTNVVLDLEFCDGYRRCGGSATSSVAYPTTTYAAGRCDFLAINATQWQATRLSP